MGLRIIRIYERTLDMRFIVDFIKGIFIGVANIIPGVSGGTMAVSMGIYDKLIGSINNLTKQFKKGFITLLPIILGMVAGIAAFSFIIPYCLTNFSFQTCMCFAGLIIGGIPELIISAKNALSKENRKFNFAHITAFIILMGVAVFMAVASPSSSGDAALKMNAGMILLLLLMGAICAAAMVIPGISGSLILMLMGYYGSIIGTISGFLTALKNLDGPALLQSLLVLVPFGIGCILGVLLISKLITFLLKRFESVTYFAIIGLVIASPFAIFYNMEPAKFSPVSIIVGIILLIAGAAFTYLFGKKNKEQ